MAFSVFAQDDEAEENFYNFLDELVEDRIIPDTDGSTTYYGDYDDEWAQIDYYQWVTFENAERFVLSANVSWTSASQTPNNYAAGCGIIFNAGSGSANHLLASIRMDGLVYFTGYRNNNWLSYGTYRYGRASTKGTADLVLVVDNDRAWVYLDGQRIVSKANLQIMGDSVGLCTLSGTNRDFGTRCEYKDIYFYTW